jgi:hypothetical protein
VDFHGEKRRCDTHESKTDKDALLFKKSKGGEARLAYLDHVLMENRQGLMVDAKVTQVTGTAEREAAVDLVDALGGTQRITLGADKNYDTQGIHGASLARHESDKDAHIYVIGRAHDNGPDRGRGFRQLRQPLRMRGRVLP